MFSCAIIVSLCTRSFTLQEQRSSHKGLLEKSSTRETYFWYLIMICGCEDGELTQCGPSGAYFAWNATALGINYINGKTFLERRGVGPFAV
ncbi:proteasome subunit alpha type-2-like isoform X2 [Rhodnius prolixus]|uniref:proteasome subunit alpha type-2-like isoform X2 n=1 Tax=Rhodnius prolixus TaxID=13249 RepID=UPI003D18D804